MVPWGGGALHAGGVAGSPFGERENGSVEDEENRPGVDFSPFARVYLEFRLDPGRIAIRTTQERTEIKAALRPSSYFYVYSVSYSAVFRLYVV